MTPAWLADTVTHSSVNQAGPGFSGTPVGGFPQAACQATKGLQVTGDIGGHGRLPSRRVAHRGSESSDGAAHRQLQVFEAGRRLGVTSRVTGQQWDPTGQVDSCPPGCQRRKCHSGSGPTYDRDGQGLAEGKLKTNNPVD